MRVTTRLEPVNQAAVVLVGVPMLDTFLMLRTDWSSGRTAAYTWELGGATPGSAVEVRVAGTTHTVQADASGTARFVWDGRDEAGRPAGPAIAVATVDGEARRMRLGRWDPVELGLGGLMLRSDDHLDALGRRIHTAHGRLRGNVPVRSDGDGHLVTKSRGRLLCRFDADGAITRVDDARTGEALRVFGRDEQGLTSITAGTERLTITREQGRVIASRDGWSLQLETREDGRAVALTDPSGRGVALRHDDRGLLVGCTDASGFDHGFEYDDAGRLVAVTAPGEGRTRLVRTRTEHGHRVTVLSAEGRESSYQTDRLEDGTTVRTMRCCGDRPTVTRIEGSTITVQRPDGTRVVNERSNGQRQVVRPSGVARTRTVRDGTITVNGRSYDVDRGSSGARVASPLGREVGVVETEDGLKITRSDGVVELVHDDRGRVTRVTSGESSMQAEYDDRGLPTVVRWSDGGSTRFEHDASGWLTAQHVADDRVVRLERDGGGLVRAVTTPGGGTTRFGFAAPGRLTSVEFPAPPGEDDRIDLEYDQDGHAVARTVAGRPTVSYRRGAGGEVEAITCGDDVATMEHAHGRMVTGRTADGQTTHVDRDGPVVTGIGYRGPVTGSVHYDRDEEFGRSGIRSGGLAAPVTHDDDGLVSSIGPATMTRDRAGRVTAITAGVVEQSYAYTPAGLLARTALTAGGATVWSVAYERDASGRITRLEDSRLPSPVEYAYDAAHRLVRATGGHDDVAITYDDNGNPTTIERDGGVAAGTVEAGDRLVALGRTTVAHGPGGMVASVGDFEVQRGATGRVTALDRGGRRTRVRRDVLGAPLALEPAEGPPQHFVCGLHGRPEVVVDEDGTPRLLLAGVGASATPLLAIGPERTVLLASDHVGSVRLVVDIATGEVVEARDYDVWGRRVRHEGTSEVPYGFAGGIDDPGTGLVHFPARTYSPELTRWLRRDPELFLGGGANLYAYANNDPVNHRDPSGRKVEVCRAPTNILPSWAPGGGTQEHWWLRTDEAEAGMGYDPTTKYEVVPSVVVEDHTGAAENNDYPCDEVEDVDEECVNEHLRLNKSTSSSSKKYGKWLGFYGPTNTCQNFVDDVLSACSDGDYSIETTDPDAYDNYYSPDVDTHQPESSDTSDSGDTSTSDDSAEQDYTPERNYTPDPGMSTEDGGSLWE